MNNFSPTTLLLSCLYSALTLLACLGKNSSYQKIKVYGQTNKLLITKFCQEIAKQNLFVQLFEINFTIRSR